MLTRFMLISASAKTDSMSTAASHAAQDARRNVTDAEVSATQQ